MVLFSLHEFQVGGTSSSGPLQRTVEDCDAVSGPFCMMTSAVLKQLVRCRRRGLVPAEISFAKI